jgi:predicted dehydrogenase
MSKQTSSRRRFLGQIAAGAAAPLFFQPLARGAASDRLNIAAVGVGGKGRGDIESVSKDQNVVAICDVDERTLAEAAKRYPDAKTYTDWRKLLEQKDIDALTVSTPDHMHAPVAVSAMQLGKHVYVQKPLAHTIHEARQMRKLAQQYGVVTQMGNQGHSSTGYRTLVKVVQDGCIGKVREAHAWSNRPIWPQGIERPKGSSPVPDYLHWNEWLGVAPFRPYVGADETSQSSETTDRKRRRKDRGPYHPFNWRGWLDFGVGALGDMGCHIIDPVVWSLELGAPKRVWSDGPAPNGETYPEWETIHYEFPATPFTAPGTVQMTWYDGGRKPDAALAPLPAGKSLPDNGCLLIGDKGVLLCEHGGSPQLLPEKDFSGTIEAVRGDDHYMQWTNACKGMGKTTSHFDYAGPLTETVLLGTIAIRFPNQKLDWNSADLKFPNQPAADKFIRKTYREGWQVKGLS